MKNNDKTTLDSPSKLLEDLKALVTEAEKLIRSDGVDSSSDEGHGALRDRFDRTQVRLGDLYADTRDRVAASAKCADASVRSNPYQSLAIAVGVGLLIGAMARGKSK